MLKTVKQHNEDVRRRLKEKEEAIYKTGVECPKCHIELRFTDPHSILMSYPAQKRTACPDCDFKCTILVD